MNKNLIILIILFFASYSYGQIDTTKIPFVSYWSIGDSYDFKITKIKKRWKEGVLDRNQKEEYIANFTVIDSTENSYTIKWSYENDLVNTYNIPEALLDKFSKYKLTEILYKTSEVGDLIEILNWKEVGELMNNMFDDIVDVLGGNDPSEKEQLKTAMQSFKDIYSSKQGVEQLVLKELQYFHFPLGIELDISEPLLYDEALPNMFGGDPIMAKAKLYVEDVDFDSAFCILKQELRLNPVDTKEMLKQVFERMKLSGDEMNKILETSVFEINDSNTFEYYFNPGLPHRIETVREAIIDIANDKGKRIERTLIELIYKD